MEGHCLTGQRPQWAVVPMEEEEEEEEEKNEWSCICAPPCSFMVCTGTTLPLQQNSQNFPSFLI